MELLTKPVNKYARKPKDTLIIKNYDGKTVMSKFPDMTNITPSDAQKGKRSRFAEAVAYAKSINSSPILRADFIRTRGEVRSVYQAALQEYLKREE